MKYGLKDIFQNVDIGDIVLSNDNYPNNNYPMYVSNIVHAATVEVDESGTKATAATSMIMQNSISKNNTINFIANHEFLYYIKYKPYNLIIFIGQYN